MSSKFVKIPDAYWGEDIEVCEWCESEWTAEIGESNDCCERERQDAASAQMEAMRGESLWREGAH